MRTELANTNKEHDTTHKIRSHRLTCFDCGTPATWIGTTPTGDHYMCRKCRQPIVTLSQSRNASSAKSVTGVMLPTRRCIVCSVDISDKNRHAKTCGSHCRKKLQRMNAITTNGEGQNHANL